MNTDTLTAQASFVWLMRDVLPASLRLIGHEGMAEAFADAEDPADPTALVRGEKASLDRLMREVTAAVDSIQDRAYENHFTSSQDRQKFLDLRQLIFDASRSAVRGDRGRETVKVLDLTTMALYLAWLRSDADFNEPMQQLAEHIENALQTRSNA